MVLIRTQAAPTFTPMTTGLTSLVPMTTTRATSPTITMAVQRYVSTGGQSVSALDVQSGRYVVQIPGNPAVVVPVASTMAKGGVSTVWTAVPRDSTGARTYRSATLPRSSVKVVDGKLVMDPVAMDQAKNGVPPADLPASGGGIIDTGVQPGAEVTAEEVSIVAPSGPAEAEAKGGIPTWMIAAAVIGGLWWWKGK